MITLPNKKYSLIYEDPAWTYDDKCSAGKRGAFFKYTLMSLEEMKALPVNDITNDDAIIFMWCTWPKLLDGTCMEVMRAHGFTPKTCAFNWVKYNKESYTPFMGMGRWTRANTEICVLGTKGKPKRISAGVRQLIETIEEEEELTGNYNPEIIQTKIDIHSKKPDIVRRRIVELCGDLPRLEMNAREIKDGWDVWGDEAKENPTDIRKFF